MNNVKFPTWIALASMLLLAVAGLQPSAVQANDGTEETQFVDGLDARVFPPDQPTKRRVFAPVSLAPGEKVKVCAAAVHSKEHVLLARQVNVAEPAPRIPIQWLIVLYGIDDLNEPLKEIQPEALEPGRGACVPVNGFEVPDRVPPAIVVVVILLGSPEHEIIASAQLTAPGGETKMLLPAVQAAREAAR